MKTEPQMQDSILDVEEFREFPEEDGHRLELSRGRVVRELVPGEVPEGGGVLPDLRIPVEKIFK